MSVISWDTAVPIPCPRKFLSTRTPTTIALSFVAEERYAPAIKVPSFQYPQAALEIMKKEIAYYGHQE